MEKTSSYFSSKMKLITFISMLAVVFIHAYNYTDNFLQPNTLITEGLHFGACLEFLISNALTRFAVPMFFAVSGYFFFFKKDFTPKTYGKQLLKRLRSIVVVFLIFSILSFAICYIIYQITGPGVISMFDERMVEFNKGGIHILYPLLQNPFAFQLWFLVQLFIMSIMSPVIYFLVKKLKWAPLVILFVLWLFDKSLNISNYTLFNCDAYLFFTLGAYLSVNKVKLPGMNEPIKNKWVKYIFLSLWAFVGVVFTLLAATLNESSIIQLFLFKLVSLLGIVVVWLFINNINSKIFNNKIVNTIKDNNFMVYLVHEPFHHIIFMATLHYFNFDVLHIILYFVLPVIIIIGCAYFGKLLRKILPRLNNILTGGR